MGARRGPALRPVDRYTLDGEEACIRRTGRDVAAELLAALGGAMLAAKSS
jgi:hypothetical protein